VKQTSTSIGSAWALLASLAFIGPGSPAQGADVPAYLKSIVGSQAASAAEVGTKNILQLNTSTRLGADRRTVRTCHLSIDEIRQPQHHGAGRGGDALSRQSQ
jgi:hypothetical protein